MRVNGRQPPKPPKTLQVIRSPSNSSIQHHTRTTAEPTLSVPVQVFMEPEEDIYWNYTVKYAHVDARSIINMCGPEFLFPVSDWNDPDQLKHRMDVAQAYIQGMNTNLAFFTRLEASILKSGFRNPILLTSGYPKFKPLGDIPPSLMVPPQHMLVCEVLGGARLLIAQKHGMKIPAIINDFVGMFDHERNLDTPEQVAQYFQDIPNNIVFTNRGLRISPPRHMHLSPELQDPKAVKAIQLRVLRNI